MQTMTYAEFRKKHPATRCFQSYDSDTRATHAASHRLGIRQRAAVGHHFYTHPTFPDIAFDSAKAATTRAYDAYLEQQALLHVLADLGE